MDNVASGSFQPIPMGGTSQPEVARCVTHPNVAATFCCYDCGKTFCDTCAFKEEAGTICTECMVRRSPKLSVPSSISSQPSAPPGPLIREGVKCQQHSKVKAVEQCKLCGGFMCQTCDFSFPNDVHLCPVCATKTEHGLSPRRKKFLIWSFVMAAWATMGMACLFSGALSGFANDKNDAAALGWIIIIFVLAPAITGLSLGLSTRDNRTGNPPAIWIAITWNAIMIASFVILDLIGLARR